MIEIIIKDNKTSPLLYMIQDKIQKFLDKSNLNEDVRIVVKIRKK